MRNEPPDADVVVGSRGHDRAAVGAEGAGVFGLERLRQRIHALAVLDAPDLARVVRAGAHEEAAVGAERHVVDRPGVPFQRAQRLAGERVPELDLLVVAAGGEPFAVGREFRVVEDVAVALETPDQRAVGDVPDRRDATQARDARGRDQAAAIGGEMQGRDLAGELAQRAIRRRAAGRVPVVEADLVAARATASHRPSGVASIATTGRTFACDGIFGTISVRRSGSWPCGPRAPDSIQASISAISSAPGRGSSLGGIVGFAGTRQQTDDAAPLGIAGQERGAVRGPSLQRGVAFERELPLAILVVMAACAVLLEDGSDSRRVIRGRSAFGPEQPGPRSTTAARIMSLDIGDLSLNG